MKLVLSGIIVFSILLYVLSIFSAFVDVTLTPKLMLLALIIGGVSAIWLVIILIKERLRDREVEKDDLSKY
ncbi:MAG: hypothetical protein GX039_05590 [Clostridia bacterium]|nr:hypothetical protein [Clostridia bacterium]